MTATTYEERAELRAMRREAREVYRRTQAAATAGAVLGTALFVIILATVTMGMLGI